MKLTKKLFAFALVLAMVLSMVACSSGDTTTTTAATEAAANAASGDETTVSAAEEYWAGIDALDYDAQSDALYDANLGEFYEAYTVAKEETSNLSLRTALMAIADAKLMESGVFMPAQGDGGSYAMSRVVPRSAATVSWGLDEYKWYKTLVCNEIITSEDRTALTALWKDAADEDEWMTAARAYLDENGYTLTDTYNKNTTYELVTWDVINTYYTSDSYFISCTFSSLLEYDSKNVQQPALATSYEVSDDGLTYTFHIREGVKWVDQQGREIGEVTADDWVASAQHVADCYDMMGYILGEAANIENFAAFVNGECTWDDVGIKAIDDYTLEYTLAAECPAFTSMLGYGCFSPLNREYYKSQGGTFSAEGDEFTSGNYGTSPSTIAYCGPYLVSNYTEKNVTSYIANEAYWNADALNVTSVNFYYNDGTDTLRNYNECKDGTIAATDFNSSSLELAKSETPDGEDGTYFELYSYTTTNSATTYCGWNNLNRGSFANWNDDTQGVSEQTEDDAFRTRAAMNNQNFRLALNFAFDRGSYMAVTYGEDLKYASLKNAYVPGDFMVTTEEVTVDINGTATTFPAGTYFGEIEQAQLDADGIPITVWDPDGNDGIGSGDGFDGWYNVDNAVAYLEKAIEELAADGVEISAENPIYIDVPYGSYNDNDTNRKNVYKQSIEENLGGCVIVNLVAFADSTNYTYSYYRTNYGYDQNYDVAVASSGWGPDYNDATTYLDTILPYGSMAKCIGLY